MFKGRLHFCKAKIQAIFEEFFFQEINKPKPENFLPKQLYSYLFSQFFVLTNIITGCIVLIKTHVRSVNDFALFRNCTSYNHLKHKNDTGMNLFLLKVSHRKQNGSCLKIGLRISHFFFFKLKSWENIAQLFFFFFNSKRFTASKKDYLSARRRNCTSYSHLKHKNDMGYDSQLNLRRHEPIFIESVPQKTTQLQFENLPKDFAFLG